MCEDFRPEDPTVQQADIGRRQFLSVLTSALPAAVVTAPTSAAADTEPPDERRKARYRESEHVETYYRVNRY
jgi:hypothetical protein